MINSTQTQLLPPIPATNTANGADSPGFEEISTPSGDDSEPKTAVARPRINTRFDIRATSFGDYRLIRPLGMGGMGTVYLAHRRKAAVPGEIFALKVMNPGGSPRRFNNEARILSRLNHPNIVRVFDRGCTSDGRPFLAMEYVEGESIHKYCDERRLSLAHRLRLFREVCLTVQAVHDHHVVHRDLKPSNILVTTEGETKLLDFGIAKQTDQTPCGSPVGLTPAFSSPEQLQGLETNERSDIYSLGALLYKLLVGKAPHSCLEYRLHQLTVHGQEDPPTTPSLTVSELPGPGSARLRQETLRRLSFERLATPHTLVAMLRGNLDSITLKALSPKIEERYGSAAELAEDIGRHLAGRPARARRDTLGFLMSKLVKRTWHIVVRESAPQAETLQKTLQSRKFAA